MPEFDILLFCYGMAWFLRFCSMYVRSSQRCSMLYVPVQEFLTLYITVSIYRIIYNTGSPAGVLFKCMWPQSPPLSKLNITTCDSTRQNTWSYLRRMPVPPSWVSSLTFLTVYFALCSYKLCIFDFEEEETGTQHVTITTSKCSSGIFCWVQHPCQVSIDKTYFIGIIHVTKVILDYHESKEIGGCKEHNIMPFPILTPSVRRSKTQGM